ncbi:PoNi-like cognate immunity protein [Cupriavidus sp. UME77]|uniref:PoNe immunity protein domain-containing protein n=1 Tax=Cupriavidus sp. UME77 TaxID=1862321 RepID=UPI001604311C
MIRDTKGTVEYWDEAVDFSERTIDRFTMESLSLSGDPEYRPQFLFEIVKEYYQLMLERYSRGDAPQELAQYFLPLLSFWEDSERLGRTTWTTQQCNTRHSWSLNLDHYIVCFWLVGLALVLDIPGDQWQRLIVLIGNDGEDALLDRVIATRQLDRKIGTKVCQASPYARLLEAIEAPPSKQANLLREFVQHWYEELHRSPKRPGLSGATAVYDRPYWYTLGDKQLEDSGYFGRWCIEAVAVAKAFGIDDTLCLDHPNYPGDLLMDGRSPRYPDAVAAEQPSAPTRGWLQRLLGK